MKNIQQPERAGFTLIEVIAALVLIGIAGAMMVTLISHSLTQVNIPRETLREAFALQSVMENIVARSAVLNDLAVLSAEIGSENSSMNNSFGDYAVEHNRFISFNGANEEVVATSTNNLLKISIENKMGETITRLFAEKL